MVDISDKPRISRKVRANGFIRLKPETLRKVKAGEIPKGDVLTVAQTAAILAVKRTHELLPLTHPIPITSADVKFELEKGGIRADVEVRSEGQTGVEMESLVGVANGLLTIWDMVKSFEKDRSGQYPTTSIENIHIVRKVKD